LSRELQSRGTQKRKSIGEGEVAPSSKVRARCLSYSPRSRQILISEGEGKRRDMQGGGPLANSQIMSKTRPTGSNKFAEQFIGLESVIRGKFGRNYWGGNQNAPTDHKTHGNSAQSEIFSEDEVVLCFYSSRDRTVRKGSFQRGTKRGGKVLNYLRLRWERDELRMVS